MPCWTIQTNKVEWKHVDKKLLAEALKKANANIVFNDLNVLTWYDPKGTGVLFTLQEDQLTARYMSKSVQETAMNQQKQLYSRHVVISQAQRFGWKVQDLGNNKLQIMRRG